MRARPAAIGAVVDRDVHADALERSRKRASLRAWNEAVRMFGDRRVTAGEYLSAIRDWQNAGHSAGLGIDLVSPSAVAEGL